jgi:ankyrin repeat protein
MPLLDCLIRKNVNINAQDDQGMTSLHLASMFSVPEVVEYLIKNNANISTKDCNGMTALDYASTMEKVNILREHGAVYASPFKALMRALHVADKDSCEVIQFLIYKVPDVNACDNSGRTPLHAAARNYIIGMRDVVKTLLDQNANIEARDLEGMTALHHAAKQGLPDVVQLLVDMKANIDVIDNIGKKPVDWARVCNRTDVVYLLTK